jgi:hypothetical protein
VQVHDVAGYPGLDHGTLGARSSGSICSTLESVEPRGPSRGRRSRSCWMSVSHATECSAACTTPDTIQTSGSSCYRMLGRAYDARHDPDQRIIVDAGNRRRLEPAEPRSFIESPPNDPDSQAPALELERAGSTRPMHEPRGARTSVRVDVSGMQLFDKTKETVKDAMKTIPGTLRPVPTSRAPRLPCSTRLSMIPERVPHPRRVTVEQPGTELDKSRASAPYPRPRGSHAATGAPSRAQASGLAACDAPSDIADAPTHEVRWSGQPARATAATGSE